MDILGVWNRFKERISLYEIFKNVLNPGCSREDLAKVEDDLKVNFPEDLKSIYLTNNGQKGNVEGIFKAISGYSKTSRPKFLEIDKVKETYKHLANDKDVDVFTPELIPFAVDSEGDLMDDVYCIDSNTGEVFLLWVAAYDWTLPAEWQTSKKLRSNTLAEFIKYQLNLD